MAMRDGRRLLTPDDWAEAALMALAEGGVSAVAVDRIARTLGASRGSFYWHFDDRAALVAAALDLWERRCTTEVITELAAVADPRQRLRLLFEEVFGDDPGGLVESALASHAGDAAVAPVLDRVTRTRLEFLAGVFRDLGFPEEEALTRARVAYTAYLGHFQLRRAASTAFPPATPDYLEQLMTIFTEPSAPSAPSVIGA
ncbi:TetR/AcrR family transcriptional regulator [Streptosporangium sp. NPDC000396]|uniref:TetR/AcrR family transcriptional regulator n=1 Tax=Streptosporangium sp. NPDC000396 TaxID=3366185 RepID=UPI0036949A90